MITPYLAADGSMLRHSQNKPSHKATRYRMKCMPKRARIGADTTNLRMYCMGLSNSSIDGRNVGMSGTTMSAFRVWKHRDRVRALVAYGRSRSRMAFVCTAKPACSYRDHARVVHGKPHVHLLRVRRVQRILVSDWDPLRPWSPPQGHTHIERLLFAPTGGRRHPARRDNARRHRCCRRWRLRVHCGFKAGVLNL